jgi:uncharacterized membrane protein YgcG
VFLAIKSSTNKPATNPILLDCLVTLSPNERNPLYQSSETCSDQSNYVLFIVIVETTFRNKEMKRIVYDITGSQHSVTINKSNKSFEQATKAG